MEGTFGGVSSVVESSLYHNVHSILRELDAEPQAGSACNKGMLRWTLHNRVENNPSISVPLLRVLIKELEKAERIDSKIRIIPLLHTLVYTVLQSVFIPEDLYRRMYLCLESLVKLPEPYCAVALNYARQMKMEQNAPGILYQRRVSAEHNLCNDLYPLREKVFVFVDPVVFPLSLVSALKADVECADPGRDSMIYKRRVILHTVLAGLGKKCQVDQLSQSLEHLGEELDLHFQDLVTILEQRTEDGPSDDNQYKTRLQEFYQDILTAAKDPSCPASQAETQLPSPEVSFHVWTKEDVIWNELVNFALYTDRNPASLDEDDLKRTSVVSTDSGIEGDMPISELSSIMLESQGGPEEQSSSKSFYRRLCMRCPKAGNRMTLMMEAIKGNEGSSLTKEQRNLTARILVMGDDRTLGRLARTLHTIRKKEARHLLLTKRVNIEMYYIPVTDQTLSPVQEGVPEDMLTLAGYLGSVDPWYDCNINGLGAMILKLAQMKSTQSESSGPNTFLLDIISYYTRVSLHPVHLPIYSVKICFSGLSSTTVEEVFVAQLAVDFPEVKRYKATFKDTIKGSVRYKKYNPQEFHGSVVSINYRKASISDREKEMGMSLATSGMLISVLPSCRVRSLHSVSISLQDMNPTRPSTHSFRAVSANIRVLEEQTFTVCLDKDPRKTFRNVHSIKVSPCLDPGYSHQPSTKSKYSLAEGSESLGKYVNKTLTLPINTFCGTEQ
ncbi:phosphoinositide 3-kinase regulatory subunit 6-like isoform X1 [Carassius auratus]|uniref:Phosphoinositide 3-kinase regulatory subunit 6-like isoform X1 n=1 Tax=Carassius auratus TaxID=7957 RepID=A0A6P6JUN2_CARAU|nr:phosphoinositide 3-kinase regulatory subunit 6-like isoform X1 [Carassius auratus]XP_026063586.1 phosphoinositide 3-kinase regulatory subunit 6-like isoform X1 [Carassius auratus]